MAFVELSKSPFAVGHNHTKMYYREYGRGYPLIFLHSGWGYEIYHFYNQIEVFKNNFHIFIPDRIGYGLSTQLEFLPANFHQLAVFDLIEFMDSLAIEKAFLWGHSDGAVISAIAGLTNPYRIFGVILEAFHFFRAKPKSLEFFKSMIYSPEDFGERVTQILAKDHSPNYWRKVLQNGGNAWLEIIAESDKPEKDFYFQRLEQLNVPTMFIHGKQDPRTEINEMEAVEKLLPQATFHFLEEVSHSPHTSSKGYANCNSLAKRFFESLVNIPL